MFSRAMGLVYWLNQSARSIAKNMTVRPLARMLYGKISTEYPTSRPDQAVLYARKKLKMNATTELAAAVLPAWANWAE